MSQTYLLAALEAVIGSGDQIKLQDLWDFMISRYKSANDFESVCGKSLESFANFLNSHSNLFVVSGDTVLLTDLTPQNNTSVTKNCTNSAFISKNGSSDFKCAFDAEAEAVKYFQEHLLKKTERWIPIRSLAGHLSQASPRIRSIVGPQQEFAKFLSTHPLIFEVQGDLVGLTNCPKNDSRPSSLRGKEKKSRPVSLDSINRFEGLFSFKSTFNEHTSVLSSADDNVFVNNVIVDRPKNERSISNKKLLSDYSDSKAILWLTYIINCKSEGNILLPALLAEVIRAPENIRRTVGRTQIELLEFLRRHNRLFVVDDYISEISMNDLDDLHIVVVAKRNEDNNASFLLSQRGSIYCIKKLWGIIDLGFHEHVFFDRSLFKNVVDLSKHFEVNEPVYFNAVLASKESRAKWRATCVWKETDQLANRIALLHNQSQTDPCFDDSSDNLEDPDSGLDNSDELVGNQGNQASLLPSLFEDMKTEFEFCLSQFASITVGDICDVNEPRSNSVLDSLNHNTNRTNNTNNNGTTTNLRVFEERIRSSSPSSSIDSISELNTLSGIPSICAIPDQVKETKVNTKTLPSTDHSKRVRTTNVNSRPKLSSSGIHHHTVSTQTFFTGDIMATKFYHE